VFSTQDFTFCFGFRYSNFEFGSGYAGLRHLKKELLHMKKNKGFREFNSLTGAGRTLWVGISGTLSGIAHWRLSSLSLFLLFFFSAFGLRADFADKARVETMAKGWLKASKAPLGKKMPELVKGVDAYKTASGDVAFYVVNLSPVGFMIVPADDYVEPVVAFSPDGQFVAEPGTPLYDFVYLDIPKRIEKVKGGQKAALNANMEFSAPKKMSSAKAKWNSMCNLETFGAKLDYGTAATLDDLRVDQLVLSLWSQGKAGGENCYNYFTPNNYVCGCVATALAQLLRFHQFPVAGIGVNIREIYVGDTPQNANTRGGDGLGAAYNWALMPLDPSVSTDAQRQMIGALCYDAGVSVNMSYTSGESGSDTLVTATALKDIFKYSNAVKGYNSADELVGNGLYEMVNPNLDAGLPVLLGISSPDGGHAIVCDGYGYNISTMYHHLNMGWAGSNNTWYDLPNIDTFNKVYKCIYNVFTSGTGEIISGRVLDGSAAPLAGVQVAANDGTGGILSGSTDQRGIYAIKNVKSNTTYSVTCRDQTSQVVTGASTDDSTTCGNKWGVNFRIAEYKLTMSVNPPGSGITSPVSGSSSVPDGLPQNITASAATGYHFVNWTASGGAAVAISNSASTTATLTAAGTVTAEFEKNSVAIITDKDAVAVQEGSTNIFRVKLSAQPIFDTIITAVTLPGGDPDIRLSAGASLTFTPEDWDTYQDVVIYADEDDDPENGTAIIRLSSDGLPDKDVAATESDNDTTLTVTDDGNGTATPSGDIVVAKSAATAIDAAASDGYHFVNWTASSGSANFGNANEASTSAAITAPATICANFAINTYTVNFTLVDNLVEKGTRTGGGELIQIIEYGSAATAPMVAGKAGWTFNAWDLAFDNITSNLTVTAEWEKGPPAICDPGSQKAMVGVPFILPLTVESDSSALSSVTVSGLPTGLKYVAKTKTISGVPTAPVAGKTVTITAKNAFKTPAVLTFNMMVEALPRWAYGTFNGWGVNGEDYGTATMTVTALGKITGKLSAAGDNFPFSAASYSQSDEDGAFWISTKIIVDKEDVPLSFKITAPAGTELPNLSLAEGWPAIAVEGKPAVKMYRNVWKETGAAEILEPYIGYYTALLPGGAEYGSGYLTLTVDKSGAVKTSGKLADGTALSLSGPLILDGNEPACLFAVIYTSPAAYKGGCLFGLVEFFKPEGEGHVYLRLYDTSFQWRNLNPHATSVDGQGFKRKLLLVGGWYDRTGKLDDYYKYKELKTAADAGSPVPQLTVGGISYDAACWEFWDIGLSAYFDSSEVMSGLSAPAAGIPVKIDSKWNYSADNCVGLKMGFAHATGIFKGSFKAWFDYNKTHTSKSISFEGVLTPEREDKADVIEGRGFFLWSDPLPGYPFKRSYDFLIQSGE
jgi:hypothetical protein